MSDNSEADEQQNHTESYLQPLSPAKGMCATGIASPGMPYAPPAQVGVGNVMVLHMMLVVLIVFLLVSFV